MPSVKQEGDQKTLANYGEEGYPRRMTRRSMGLACGILMAAFAVGCGADRAVPTGPTIDQAWGHAATPAGSRLGGDADIDDDSVVGSGASGRRRVACRDLVDEAVAELGAVYSGEQVFFQRLGVYTNIADTEELGTILGFEVSALSPRWLISVRDASTDGFVAEARGRRHTSAHAIVVTLRHSRTEGDQWQVSGRCHSCGVRLPGSGAALTP
jgi:hypothetical protein